MVGHRVLVASIGVRVPVPQQKIKPLFQAVLFFVGGRKQKVLLPPWTRTAEYNFLSVKNFEPVTRQKFSTENF